MTKWQMKHLLRLLDHFRGGCICVIGDQRSPFEAELLGDRLEMMIDSDLCTGSESWNRDDLGEDSTETAVNQSSGKDRPGRLPEAGLYESNWRRAVDRQIETRWHRHEGW